MFQTLQGQQLMDSMVNSTIEAMCLKAGTSDFKQVKELDITKILQEDGKHGIAVTQWYAGKRYGYGIYAECDEDVNYMIDKIKKNYTDSHL